jgi:hypothetical protein
MGARIAFAILGTALLGLGIFPAEARNSGGGVSTGHFARAMPGHSFIVPRQHFAGRIIVFNRDSGRFFAVNRFGFNRFGFNRFGFTGAGQFSPFGFSNGFGGFDGFSGDFGAFDGSYGPGAVNTSPSIVLVPQPTQPARAQIAANLPPCHEMTPAGVAIDRGMGCSRAPQ